MHPTAWGKLVEYPDKLDLLRVDQVKGELPSKSQAFLEWIFKNLSNDHCLGPHGLTPTEYDQETIVVEDSNSGWDFDANIDQELKDMQQEIIYLDNEKQLVEMTNERLRKQLKIITAEKVKQGTGASEKIMTESTISTPFPVEIHVRKAKEQEHALRAISSKILEVEPSRGKYLHKLHETVSSISDVEASLLKKVAIQSANFFNSPLMMDYSTAIAASTSSSASSSSSNEIKTIDSLQPSQPTQNPSDDDYDTMIATRRVYEYEQELKRESAKRMSDARSRLLEIIYDAKVLEKRTEAETEYRKKWIRCRGDLNLINESKNAGSGTTSDRSNSDGDGSGSDASSVAGRTFASRKSSASKVEALTSPPTPPPSSPFVL